MQDPIKKITKAERAGCVAQVEQFLLMKHRPRVQNPNATKKKKKKN
jgi:hypothetical protein